MISRAHIAETAHIAEGDLQAKFRNIGEACMAANRFLGHESVASEFVARVTERVATLKIGRGTEDGVSIGPLIDERAVAKATALVGDAVERGATVTTGGSAIDGPGTFYQPTVVTGVRAGSDIRAADDRVARNRHDGTERRCHLERGGAVRRRQAVRAGPRGRPRRHPRIPGDEVRHDPESLRMIARMILVVCVVVAVAGFVGLILKVTGVF